MSCGLFTGGFTKRALGRGLLGGGELVTDGEQAAAGGNGQGHSAAARRRVRCAHHDLLHVSIGELARPFNAFAGNDVRCRRRRPRSGSLHVPTAGRLSFWRSACRPPESVRRAGALSAAPAQPTNEDSPTAGAATGAIRRATFARG